jgi:membrane protein
MALGKSGALDLAGAARLALAALVTGARAMRGEIIRLRAGALTYLTLFALVPGLVAAFSVVNAFSGAERMSRVLHEFLLENLAVGARASIEPRLDEFVRNARALSGAGLVSGALLLVSAVMLLGQVQAAFNDIWAVHRRRPRIQQLLIYWAVLTLAPLLIAGSLSLAYSARTELRGSALLEQAASALLSCAFFAVMYLIVPATRVRPLPALTGGVVAGAAFEIAKSAYGWVVARFFNYHAVYGSLAAILVLLIWVYLSWTLLLFGARLAFVLQHRRVLLSGHDSASTPLAKELLAGRVMLEVAEAYDRGTPPPDPGDIAEHLEMLAEPVREMVGTLRAAGLVVEASGGGVVPARPLAQISLADVRKVVTGASPEAPIVPNGAHLAGIFSNAEGLADGRLAEATFDRLCADLRPKSGAACP